LSASEANHRRTVEAEMPTTTPASIASIASSKLDHRDSGIPRVAGSSQAIAVTCACCTGVNRRGRPGRCPSASPASPRATNRDRHLRTVSTHTARSAAMLVLVAPSAADSTIRARSTCRAWAVGRISAISAARSSSDNTI
jgi:hypothetical protein